MNSLVVLIIMKMLCQDFLEVNNALEIVYTGLMNNVVVLIIMKNMSRFSGSKQCQSSRRSHYSYKQFGGSYKMKKLCQERWEVIYANLEDVHISLMNSLVLIIMKKLCQKRLEVHYANLEDVHISLKNSLVVLIIMKMLCQELLEVNNANLEDVHTSLINSLVVLIIIKML